MKVHNAVKYIIAGCLGTSILALIQLTGQPDLSSYKLLSIAVVVFAISIPCLSFSFLYFEFSNQFIEEKNLRFFRSNFIFGSVGAVFALGLIIYNFSKLAGALFAFVTIAYIICFFILRLDANIFKKG